jgi:hypothetical protein
MSRFTRGAKPPTAEPCSKIGLTECGRYLINRECPVQTMAAVQWVSERVYEFARLYPSIGCSTGMVECPKCGGAGEYHWEKRCGIVYVKCHQPGCVFYELVIGPDGLPKPEPESPVEHILPVKATPVQKSTAKIQKGFFS